MEARDLMQGPVEDIMACDDIYLAFGKMRRYEIHHLPVVDTKSKLIGILSDRDILRALAEVANSDAPMPLVRDWMNPQVVTCNADESVESIVDKLMNESINCLPVVDSEKRCIGMITSRDIIRLNLLGRTPGPQTDSNMPSDLVS